MAHKDTEAKNKKANAKPDRKKTDDILVEDNRFSPFGALKEKSPGESIQGAPVNPVHGK